MKDHSEVFRQDRDEILADDGYKHPNPSKAELAGDIAGFVLTGLHKAAKISKFPYLQDAAEAALTIVSIAQEVKSNRKALRGLARDAGELVYVVILTVERLDSLSENLMNDLRQLVKRLSEIERFVKKEVGRSRVLRAVKHKSDQDMIAEYRQGLRQSLDIFGLQSNITIQGNILRIQENLERLNGRDNAEDQMEKIKHEPEESEVVRLKIEKQRMEDEGLDGFTRDELVREWERREAARLEEERREEERIRLAAASKKAEDERKIKELEEKIRTEKLRKIEEERERMELKKLQRDKEERERELRATAERLARLRLEEEERRARMEARLAEEARRPSPSPSPSPSPAPSSTSSPTPPPWSPWPPGTPFAQSTPGYFSPGFPGNTNFENVTMNNTGAANNIYNGAVWNYNSGNTNTNIVTNSGNDSSIRIYGRDSRR